MSVTKTVPRKELGRIAYRGSNQIKGIGWLARTTNQRKTASYRTGIPTKPRKGELGYKPSGQGLFPAQRIGRAYKGIQHHIMLPTLDDTYAQKSNSQTLDEVKQKIANDQIYYVKKNGITYIPED
jgi:hypothetical protein